MVQTTLEAFTPGRQAVNLTIPLTRVELVLVGRMLHVGAQYRNKPLIWRTLHRSTMFHVVLLTLTTLEKLIVGVIHDRTIADSLNHVVGPIFFQGLAVCLLMFLILVPFSAFTCLSDVVGERELIRLFFMNRDVGAIVRALVCRQYRLPG